MRQLTDILRLKYEARLSHAKIAAALGLSVNAGLKLTPFCPMSSE